tara:strand:+ start:1007 stop:1171 length:165 start_codon:yes stop_codon:yes gene_type:complete
MDFNDFMDLEDRKAKVNDYVDSFVAMCPDAKEKLREEKLEELKEDFMEKINEKI